MLTLALAPCSASSCEVEIAQHSIAVFPLSIDRVVNLDGISLSFLRHLRQSAQKIIRAARVENKFPLSIPGEDHREDRGFVWLDRLHQPIFENLHPRRLLALGHTIRSRVRHLPKDVQTMWKILFG